ncbi:putative kelch-type beta propeller [Helianthus annuus]|uniref:Kelch-type beta propeller n=1 Tax=Helianthus annuus TaxID=4232 RepID=A0A251VLN2_HELAN|nr:acyl-CoA-binding domain-containing protein 4 [Helianthus annuus]XP_021971337.1 acyl-CoA-binding domain-containing protein 4 [Helianthus annuus]XP_021971339.1 acyl-CoA-binding domain-containing protein 4 [Helianthus annuus]KAF5821174.1 putative kelch-type beta propeller [Helianthus annuus]KAJ0947076.1 putative kelch-type beta propeller [Helianthus annuus]
MFAFSRKGKKLGRVKVQLSDSAQGTRSPIRHPKRVTNSNGDNSTTAINDSDDNNLCSSTAPELENSTSGNSEGWKKISTTGDKPTPRFNHAAAVIGKKMIVVGGESGNGLLEDVQVLNFENFSWTTTSSRLYLSPSSLQLKIPACKGHCLVPWGKKVLLIGGRTASPSDRVSVWAFDVETECWSLMEAKGEIPIARSGHTAVRAGTLLILFGGEDIKRRKLNDLHMFDLKTLTWLPLHCQGTGPSARCNHVAALYDDKLLLVFGGTSKSKSLNDLYSLDFETMMWSRIKIRGFHPSPRAGCCGVLCGTKWYIAGGGSRKKRHAEILVFDILKREWSIVHTSSQQSIATNKGFSLVLLQEKETDYLVAFGGLKKEPSDQVEVLVMEKNESSMSRRMTLPSEKRVSSMGPTVGSVGSFGRQNLASVIEHHGSGRKSLSETLLVSLRKLQVDDDAAMKSARSFEDERKPSAEETPSMVEPENTEKDEKDRNDDNVSFQETDGKSGFFTGSSSIYQSYEIQMAALIRKNGILEGQLAAALAGREAAEKNLSSVIKSRQEVENRLNDTLKDMELMKEKLVLVEMAQEEANSLSNIVHSDHVRLEHDVAFLKAVLDDTQKELHSTRGVLSGERARAFQLQVEVFHLKQRLQSMENRTSTPRKPYHG